MVAKDVVVTKEHWKKLSGIETVQLGLGRVKPNIRLCELYISIC